MINPADNINMYKATNSRGIAIKIINEVIYKNHSRDTVIDRYFGQEDLSLQDKDLIFNIVLNTLRYRELYDEIIVTETNKPLYKFEKTILTALETALAQMLTMERIPVYAAVSETIDAYRQITGNHKGAGFLNYLLRRLTEKQNLKQKFERLKDDNLFMKKFISELKDEIPYNDLLKLYKSSFIKPKITLRVRKDIASVRRILKRNSIEFIDSEVVPDAILLNNSVSQKTLHQILPSDSFIIQSELSQIAGRILGVSGNQSVLDVCSGNQVKALQIYDLTNEQADITSIDIKEIQNPKFRFIRADAAKVSLDMEFDRILIDAPCSGLGTLPQNPEIKFRIRNPAVKRFASVQFRILKNISKYLKSDGRLLYSVCTLTGSETTKVIKKFVEENPQFEIISPDMENSVLKNFTDNDGFLRISDYNFNSFFYALLQRK